MKRKGSEIIFYAQKKSLAFQIFKKIQIFCLFFF